MTMSIRHNVAAISAAAAMLASAVGIAIAGHGGISSSAARICEDTNIASAGKGNVVEEGAATVTATSKGNRPNDVVREGEAVVTELGVDASAITYWVSESDGWHVVTTVDIRLGQDDGTRKQAVVRFSAVLLPGQSQRISVPVAINERQQVLRIRRLGDWLEVERVFGPSV
jgi:hypothetical protein